MRLLALDHGLMNLIAAPLGGVPTRRGAGGRAGHVRFGARTAGAAPLLRLFPLPVLGVILFFGGIELAVGINGDTFSRRERTILVVTAGLALWNMGVAYLAGLMLHHAAQRGILSL